MRYLLIDQIQMLKNTGERGEAPQHLPATLFRPPSPADSADCLLPSNAYGGFPNSKCTEVVPSLVVESGLVRDVVSNPPLLADISRIEIRLLRETRSVLEYLYQYQLALIFTDKDQSYSFPKMAVLGNVDQIGR